MHLVSLCSISCDTKQSKVAIIKKMFLKLLCCASMRLFLAMIVRDHNIAQTFFVGIYPAAII